MKARVSSVVGALVVLSGCAQITTSDADRAPLQAAAGKAGEDYVTCIVNASDRYQQTGESAPMIVDVSKKACTSARSVYIDAERAYLKTKFMSTEPILNKDLAALEERATQQVQERVLERKAVSPPMAAPAVVAPVASAQAPGGTYLDCMRAEGQRYAGVNEPAEVVAEVAQSRCSALLTDVATAAKLERQGRALVMGLVLDQKLGKQ